MPKLPVISGEEAIQFLDTQLRDMGKGLLRKILRDAEISLEYFIDNLK